MTLRDLERITLHWLTIEVINKNGSVTYLGKFEKMVGDIWNREILYIHPYRDFLRVCVK